MVKKAAMWIFACMFAGVFQAKDAQAWCYVYVPSLGQEVLVREARGWSLYWAHVVFFPYPTIVYGPAYFGLPPIMQELTRYHECGHLVLGTLDEVASNCYALRRMRQEGLSSAEERYIADFHRQVGPLPPQYGGSGAMFWQMTIQNCPRH